MSQKVSYTFQDSEEQQYTPAPPGTYIFKVVKAEYGLNSGSKYKGHDQIKLTFTCVENEEGEEVGMAQDTLIFADAMAWKNDLFLKASGYAQANGLKRGDDVTFDPLELYGLRGWCQVKNRKWTSNSGDEMVSAEIGKYMPSKGIVEPDRPDPTDVPFA